MLVYLTSANMNNRWCDKTTIFNNGDEAFIDKKCWIKYQSIIIANKQDLVSPQFIFVGKISSSNLERIQKGITVSKFVSAADLELFIEWHHDSLLNQ